MYSRTSLLSVCCFSLLNINEVIFLYFSVLFSECVRTHIDMSFKEGKCRFACVENLCPGEYTIRLITELLPPKDVNRLNKRIQEENIRQGNKRYFYDLYFMFFLL